MRVEGYQEVRDEEGGRLNMKKRTKPVYLEWPLSPLSFLSRLRRKEDC